MYNMLSKKYDDKHRYDCFFLKKDENIITCQFFNNYSYCSCSRACPYFVDVETALEVVRLHVSFNIINEFGS